MNSMQTVAATYVDEEYGYVDLDHHELSFLFWRVPLDELIASPIRVNELPPEEQRKLLLQLPALIIVLVATSAMAPVEAANLKLEPDELLTAEEAAQILKVDRHWLYAHSKTLPFSRKLSHKRLRFSRIGLENWISHKLNKMK